MLLRTTFVSVLLLAHAAPMSAQRTASGAPGIISVTIETTFGTITADLDTAKAPGTVANFLRYMDAHAYDNGRFHRTVRMDNQPDNAVKIEVIQGGTTSDSTRPRWPAIALERTSITRLLHTDGTLSMARGGPDTATSDFFICIGAQPELDHGGKRNADGQGFAAFGRVTKGMDVVRNIQSQKAEAQRLTPPVTIVRVARQR